MDEFIFSKYPTSILASYRSFSIMRQQEQLTDVRLISGDGQQILAHKVVLSSSCSYFYSMFTLDLAENREGEVNLRDFEGDIINAIVLFCYGEEIRLSANCLDFLLRLTVAADHLRIEDLHDMCIRSLVSLISPANVLSLQAIGSLCNSSLLANECTHYIEEHFEEVSSCQEYLQLGFKDVMKLISDDKLNVPQEEVVYQAVMNWILHNPQQRKNLLPEMLIHVRLPFVSPQFLKDVIEENEFLRNDLFCQGLIQEAYFYQEFPSKRSILNISPRAKPRQGSSDSGIILIAGGIDSSGELDSFIQYSLETGQQTSLPLLPQKVYAMGTCILRNCLYIIGGHCSSLGVLSTVSRYEIKNAAWTQVASMQTPRRYHSVAAAHGLIYAIGGQTRSGVTSSVECYDPNSNVWTPCSPMSVSRMYHGAVTVDNMVYVVGGHNGRMRLSSLEQYDPFIEKWVQLTPMSVPRSVAGVALCNGSIVVAGGYIKGRYISVVEVYDVELDKWTESQPLTVSRSAFGLVSHEGALYALGGFNDSFVSSVEQYMPSDQMWRSSNDLELKRAHFGIASCGCQN